MLEPQPHLRNRDALDEPDPVWSSNPRLTLREIALMAAAAIAAALTVAALIAFMA